MFRQITIIKALIVIMLVGNAHLLAQDSNLADYAEKDLKLSMEMLNNDTLLPCQELRFSGVIENASADREYIISFVRDGRYDRCFEPKFEYYHEVLRADSAWENVREWGAHGCGGLDESYGITTLVLRPGTREAIGNQYIVLNPLSAYPRYGLNRYYFKLRFHPDFVNFTNSLQDSIARKEIYEMRGAVIPSDTFYVYYKKNPLTIKLIPVGEAYAGRKQDLSDIFNAYLINTSDRPVAVRLLPDKNRHLVFLIEDNHYAYPAMTLPDSNIETTLGPGERIELIGEAAKERGLSISYRPLFPGILGARVYYDKPSDEACQVISNWVEFEVRDTVADDLAYFEKKKISRKKVEQNLQLHVNMKNDSLFECECGINLDIWLVNVSEDQRFPVIAVGDGSYDGRRDGSIFYTIQVKDHEGKWKDFKKTKPIFYGCGFYDFCWLDDIVAVHPGDSISCNRFYEGPSGTYDLSEAGYYRLFVHYKCGINDEYKEVQKELKKDVPYHMFAYMPKFEIVSDPIEFEIHKRPIQLVLKPKSPINANVPVHLSDIVELQIINIASQPIDVYSPPLDRYTKLWFDLKGNLKRSIEPAWEPRDSTRNQFTIAPGETIEFFETKELSAGFDYILTASGQGILKMKAAYQYTLNRFDFTCSKQVEIEVKGR